MEGRRRQAPDRRPGRLAKQRKVTVVTGVAQFTSANTIAVETAQGRRVVRFAKAIIAAGSEPVAPGFIPKDPRIWDSTGALDLSFIPKRMLVLGGGIIGLEMATVYDALGAGITVIEMLDQLMPGADKDIVAPLAKRVEQALRQDHAQDQSDGGRGGARRAQCQLRRPRRRRDRRRSTRCWYRSAGAPTAADRRQGRGRRCRRARLHRGRQADADQRAHIFAIGDIVGQPMLAHKATHEAKVAAEVASGHKAPSTPRHPLRRLHRSRGRLGWRHGDRGEGEGLKYGKAVFPWAASGRSLSLGRDEGQTKTLWDEESGRLIGCAIVGPNAGDLIAEAALAIEMGCDAEDIGLTIHPHPTLSETFAMSAEAFAGTLTDLYMPKKR